MTKPYGWVLRAWRDEDCGPPSRFIKAKYKSRHRERQLMHKKGRRQGKAEIERQLADMENDGTFVCTRCGLVCSDRDRCPGTSECRYC